MQPRPYGFHQDIESQGWNYQMKAHSVIDAPNQRKGGSLGLGMALPPSLVEDRYLTLL
jgi:hypothetical protein